MHTQRQLFHRPGFMDSGEVPHHFICPISLQIMKDPVTTVTGITYDRASIERWLLVDRKPICPVTQQPLPDDQALLTPNHTLRRLIQSWFDAADDRCPDIQDLVRGLFVPRLQLRSLHLLAALGCENNESIRRRLVQSGVPRILIKLIASFRVDVDRVEVDLALNLLFQSLRVPQNDLKPIADGRDCLSIVDLIAQVLAGENREMKSTATMVAKALMEAASARLLEQLKTEFFRSVLGVIRDRISPQVTKAALQVLLRACVRGNNRLKIVEAGGVREVVELELSFPDKRTTEIDLGVLSRLCSCAEGRAELVGHAAGIGVVAKRILQISAAADEEAVRVLAAVCWSSATKEVLEEMVSVGAVEKLCLVLQADCGSAVKEKARWLLRFAMHPLTAALKSSPTDPSNFARSVVDHLKKQDEYFEEATLHAADLRV
ncbi:hypothetical protein ZIOFF_020510 [Zingiber officinale]|uniref:U-box domain-containing protein n=1 Tax=Zingiber officinale TaxID=94328 RepID=A0A8J5LGN5_ZINOF|nr:hypothetical protein ZIOFF_020510 [Zingiber officinale]